jgi:hypothetical protein
VVKVPPFTSWDFAMASGRLAEQWISRRLAAAAWNKRREVAQDTAADAMDPDADRDGHGLDDEHHAGVQVRGAQELLELRQE